MLRSLYRQLIHRSDEAPPPPCPEHWAAILSGNVGQYPFLSAEERARLCGDAQAFVAQKFWEGCGGLDVTEEMRVTIAGQACLMLLGQPHDYIPHARSILVYPSTFAIPEEEWGGGRGRFAADGQAMPRGPVALAWDAVLADGRDPSRGSNVVIHEFAHQLDFADGLSSGTPALNDEELARRWHLVLASEHARLLRDQSHGWPTFLGDYAATSLSELIAVASERFFTVPGLLKYHHPELYDVLAAYYRVEPTRWFAGQEMAG
jgi:Mlc titration factor MtfA (ptsG expression regulator)